MALYQLTSKAEQELDGIYEYSILNFGLNTAQDYLAGLQDCFQMLADHPSWGADYGFISSGLQRYEYRSHSIYYQPYADGILIVRVLGNKQDPARHL
jgi:toxin ParE1/3/4